MANIDGETQAGAKSVNHFVAANHVGGPAKGAYAAIEQVFDSISDVQVTGMPLSE
jgi:hypothetical protein